MFLFQHPPWVIFGIGLWDWSKCMTKRSNQICNLLSTERYSLWYLSGYSEPKTLGRLVKLTLTKVCLNPLLNSSYSCILFSPQSNLFAFKSICFLCLHNISLIISLGNVTASEENCLCCVSCRSWKNNNCSIVFSPAVLNLNRTTWKWIKYWMETEQLRFPSYFPFHFGRASRHHNQTLLMQLWQ